MSLKNVSSDINFLQKRTFSFGRTPVCSICHRELLRDITILRCQHKFHINCICPVLNNNNRLCPICGMQHSELSVYSLCNQ